MLRTSIRCIAGMFRAAFGNNTKDAAIQRASINYKPTSLKGFYKYTKNIIMGENGLQTDTALVSVFLTKATAFGTDTVGTGFVDIGDSTASYTPFEVMINYSSNQMPDSITVILDPSMLNRTWQHLVASGIDGTGVTSFLTIDNLSLTTSSTTHIGSTAQASNLKIFPNTSQGLIRFDNISGNVMVSDVSGKVRINKSLKSAQSLNVGELEAGMYFLNIIDEIGNKFKASFIKY
jgi:hypothetical protein